MLNILQCIGVQVSHSVVLHSLQPCRLLHARPPCPSPTLGVYSNSCPLSWWYHWHHQRIVLSQMSIVLRLRHWPRVGKFFFVLLLNIIKLRYKFKINEGSVLRILSSIIYLLLNHINVLLYEVKKCENLFWPVEHRDIRMV